MGRPALDMPCATCGGGTEFVDCESCVDGYDGHDCGGDVCDCGEPDEPNIPCSPCDGEGGWRLCVKRCEDEPGGLTSPADTQEPTT